MDDNTRRRRQNDPPLTNTRYHQTVQNPTQQQAQQAQQQQQQQRNMAGTSADRYRSAPLNTSPPSAGRTGMGAGSAGGYGNYYQEPSTAAGFSTATGMQQNTMGYHQSATGYGQDARQTQNFAGSYNPNLMYNVPQTGTQNSVYDATAGSFDLRQPAAQQIMPTDVTNTYFSNEPTNTAAASALQQQQPSSAQTAAVYQQGSTDNRSSMINYPSNMAGIGSIASQSNAAAADVMDESADYQANTDLNQAYTQYQDALKEIFSNVKKGALVTAGESLLQVSEWLLSHVHELGLTSDDQALHTDRIKLWDDFNHAWLATFQAQKDMMESGGALGRGQSLITEENVQKMGDDLVRLSDNIDRYGLVDYQYGVWEDRIIDIILECKELYNSQDSAGNATAGVSGR